MNDVQDAEALALGRLILRTAIDEQQPFVVRIGDHRRDIVLYSEDGTELARWRKENRSTSLNQ